MSNLSRRSFITAGVAAAGSVALSACGSSDTDTTDTTTDDATEASYTLVEEGKLTCVAELGFAPFEYMDESTGEAKGFDIDVSKAIAEKMGLEANWLPSQHFDTLVPLIKQGGKADISISGFTITDERAEEVDFSDPYLDSNQALITKAGSEETEESLNAEGKKVGCQAGTTGEEWIKENLTEATCVPLDDVSAGLAGVSTGSYDAYVIDLPVASNMITSSFTDLQVALEIPTGEQYGIIVSKDNPGLTEAINEALAEMEADGTMADIKTTWFGEDI